MTGLRALALAAAFGLPLATGAQAATDNMDFAVKGIGASTCQRYLDVKANDRALYFMYLGWIDGYITASNKYLDDTFDLTTWQSTELFATAIETQCKKNADQQVAAVIDALTGQLMPGRLTQPSEVVEAEVEDTKFRIYAEVLRRMQRKLAQEGFYDGAPDGAYGPGTRLAVERFQQENGIPVTGLPDNLTMFRLLANEGAGR
ncbi:MAG: hypothetical protein CMM50_15280 [Rhodospirillaceae bacterium]|nr:hypothetical protein [Rhodospirillaceae bacterium]|tara:strand:- start:340 stop:948 length:609 start_codon:yes stop_codon:yes gene_type:complete